MSSHELRSELRVCGFEPAEITLADGRIVECFLENWSPSGACVVLPSTERLEDGFTLESEPTGRRSGVRVMWRGVAEMGVWFGQARSAGPADGPTAADAGPRAA
jgi:hypothetical protein